MFGKSRDRRPSRAGRARLVLAVLALLCLAWLPAAAQGTPLTLAEATLRLSPEYDDPGLLVICYGTFANITTYPQAITLPVPTAAHDVQTTEQDAGNSLLTRTAQRQGDQVTYNLEKQPGFQLEYYLDREPAGNDRTFNFTWRAPYAIKTLTIVAQQPARATNFSMTPKEDTTFAGADGLTTYQITRTNVTAGEAIDLTIKYTKTDQAPSFTRTAPPTVTAAQPAPAAAPTGNAAGPNWLAIGLIGLGIAALVGAAVYWYIDRRRDLAPAPAGRAARVAAAQAPGRRLPSPAADGDAEQSRFCRKCGRPYAPGDRFCGSCGTPRDAGQPKVT